MGTFFGYTPHYVLYKMTFAQCITLIEVRNDRERKQSEGTSTSKKEAGGFGTDISKYKIDPRNPATFPNVTDIKAAMGGLNKG